MPETHHSISMGGSELSWDDVDQRAHKLGFKERSRYIQYLVEKDIFKSKLNLKENLGVILLLILAMVTMTLVMQVL